MTSWQSHKAILLGMFGQLIKMCLETECRYNKMQGKVGKISWLKKKIEKKNTTSKTPKP